ncbi:four helix bundle protein [Mesotoga sp. B105.6.4]|uniref:four helix bundle protein n=1 Tax=Mesotoga sp. B105.6.4 TaxID=1582224 RepID=UPI000CCBE779
MNAWKLSMELAKKIYDITATFSAREMCGFSSQMQRAAVSVPTNIAEGSERYSRNVCSSSIFREDLYFNWKPSLNYLECLVS